LSENKDLLKAFIHEVLVYRESLKLALEEIMDRGESQRVIFYLENLEAKGAYISDPEIARRLGAFFVGWEEDLGFYVLSSYDSGIELVLKENGDMTPTKVTLVSRPIFLYWPKAIAQKSMELAGSPLPLYLTPWVHEFGHFISYCLQERPIMVAIGILMGALRQSGCKLRNTADLLLLSKEEVYPHVWETARLLVQCSAINEAMAVWWEDHLLKALGFDADAYVARKKDGNYYVSQLESCTKEKAIDYIRNWHSLAYYPEPFTKTFLQSLSKMTIDKWSFLEGGK